MSDVLYTEYKNTLTMSESKTTSHQNPKVTWKHGAGKLFHFGLWIPDS